MRKYILTSNGFIGQVTFWFNDMELLVYYHNDANITEKQHIWLLKNIPRELIELETLRETIKGNLDEVPEDISFEAFWEAYGKKVKRVRALGIYKKMTDAQRLQAIAAIKPYDRFLQRTTWRSKADPDTYLRGGYYETDWNKEK